MTLHRARTDLGLIELFLSYFSPRWVPHIDIQKSMPAHWKAQCTSRKKSVLKRKARGSLPCMSRSHLQDKAHLLLAAVTSYASKRRGPSVDWTALCLVFWTCFFEFWIHETLSKLVHRFIFFNKLLKHSVHNCIWGNSAMRQLEALNSSIL